jgi:hypothetical protein
MLYTYTFLLPVKPPQFEKETNTILSSYLLKMGAFSVTNVSLKLILIKAESTLAYVSQTFPGSIGFPSDTFLF